MRWAADDAVWRPHSSQQRVFRFHRRYRASVEDRDARARVARRLDPACGIWSDDDVVAVRGRLRVRRGGVVEVPRLLAEVGLPGRANEAYMAMPRVEGVA